ncbi:MAG: Crp/Fnr family transcriptional regulator [Bacteriovoracaceae bacterium]
MTTPTQGQSKSGLRQLTTGEILFNDGDLAESLFIIQKGQLRLFKPKGKGFIEIAVLRAGEVIGEMAFFDEDGSGKKRSCSASALTPVDVIEITFPAFGKTMASLNPWFKTIINTLVVRLRKANIRLKELEDNQATISYSGVHKGYEFLKPLEVMRILGTLFLVFKSHGDFHGNEVHLNRKTLTLYTFDMYQIIEVKLETILTALIELGWLEVRDDQEKLPNTLVLKNLETIRQIFIFANGERHLPEEKKMRISDKCEQLLEKVLSNIRRNPPFDIPNLKINDEHKPKFTQYVNLTPILEEFKSRNISINADHVDDGRNINLFGEILMEEGKVLVEFDQARAERVFPIIKFLNHISRSNREKSGSN